jgi:hypothetical protein
MKIAICFSGESRTWEKCLKSFRHFYMSEKHDVSFFGHIWSANHWTKSAYSPYAVQELDPAELQMELDSHIHFTDLIVEPHMPEIDVDDHMELIFTEQCGRRGAMNTLVPAAWRSMFYSMMIANNLKYKYEIENDLTFDLVVRSRLDVCYSPAETLDLFVPARIDPTTLYCNTAIMEREYMLPAINDIFYMGSSHVMDLIDSFYRVYHNGDFFKLTESNFYDPGYKLVGPGVLLYKWLTMKNILPQHIAVSSQPILRNNVSCLRWPEDFDNIVKEFIK